MKKSSGSIPADGPEVASAGGSGDPPFQILTFLLVDRVFGFRLNSISEILPIVAITQVPGSTAWMPGVINLRGEALPVMELRQRLGLPPRELDPHAVIIVAEPSARAPVGFIADRVLDTMSLSGDSLSPVDDLSGDEHPVDALARADERVIAILDVDRLVADSPDLTLPELLE